MSRPHSLTEGNILTSLMGFALPVLAALFLQTMYGAVDMMIVGQFSHAAEVSAVSTGSWIMQTITTAIVGLAMGTTILLGRKIGEGQPEDAGRVMGASIWIFAVIGLAVTAVMQFLAVPCTAWMRAPKEAFDSTAVYVKICSAGSLFIVAYNLLGSIFRGLGNSRLPLISVSIACLVNIAGDLLLVGVFHMASAGAAIALPVQFIRLLVSCCFVKFFDGFHIKFSVAVRTFHLLGSTVEFHRSSTGRTFIFFYSRHIYSLSESHPIVILKQMVCRSLYRIWSRASTRYRNEHIS